MGKASHLRNPASYGVGELCGIKLAIYTIPPAMGWGEGTLSMVKQTGIDEGYYETFQLCLRYFPPLLAHGVHVILVVTLRHDT